jgi:predicted CoA-binding protein
MTVGRSIETAADLQALLAGIHHVAVLGIKPEGQSGKPAFYVPQALQALGLQISPVPVYDFGVTEILGQPIHRRLQDIPGPIDLVDVFRRSEDLPPHLPDILAVHPRAVWLQQGIRNDDFAAQLLSAGIDVVQDRCLMVDYRRFHQTQG